MDGSVFSLDPSVLAAFVWPLSLVWLAGALVAALLTWRLIGWLESRQFGKAIRLDGPDHAAKTGTPTMGGIGILVTAGLAIMLSVIWLQNASLPDGEGPPSALPSFVRSLGVVWVGLVVFSVLGLIDDLQGLARKSGKKELGVGLKARHMSLLQWLAAIALCSALLATGGLVLPGGLPSWLGILAASFIVVGCVNGANLSDGLDGLAAGLFAIAFFALSLLGAGLNRQTASDNAVREAYFDLFANATLSMIALATAGACLGFLYFNRHPARVFMGNVTSMGAGALLALLSLVSGLWILLPIFGAVFVAEVFSVILQVGYFKYSGGKRIFRMAPFHHHFELGGMHETKIVRRFWAAGLIAALTAVLLAGPLLDRFAALLPTYR